MTDNTVRSQGGKTPVPSDHPSRPVESFEQRIVTGRLNQREKVLPSTFESIRAFVLTRRHCADADFVVPLQN
jgi:hypothetical protein